MTKTAVRLDATLIPIRRTVCRDPERLATNTQRYLLGSHNTHPFTAIAVPRDEGHSRGTRFLKGMSSLADKRQVSDRVEYMFLREKTAIEWLWAYQPQPSSACYVSCKHTSLANWCYDWYDVFLSAEQYNLAAIIVKDYVVVKSQLMPLWNEPKADLYIETAKPGPSDAE